MAEGLDGHAREQIGELRAQLQSKADKQEMANMDRDIMKAIHEMERRLEDNFRQALTETEGKILREQERAFERGRPGTEALARQVAQQVLEEKERLERGVAERGKRNMDIAVRVLMGIVLVGALIGWILGALSFWDVFGVLMAG